MECQFARREELKTIKRQKNQDTETMGEGGISKKSRPQVKVARIREIKGRKLDTP